MVYFSLLSPIFQHSIIPFRWHKQVAINKAVFSRSCRIFETFNYFRRLWHSAFHSEKLIPKIFVIYKTYAYIKNLKIEWWIANGGKNQHRSQLSLISISIITKLITTIYCIIFYLTYKAGYSIRFLIIILHVLQKKVELKKFLEAISKPSIEWFLSLLPKSA